MDSTRILIIGAGLAGVATAYRLASLGETDALVIEKEVVPGMHSSGRSAAMIRQVVPDKDILPLARDGARFFHDQTQQWDDPVLFIKNGSLLLAHGEKWRSLQAEAELAGSQGIEYEVWNSRQVVNRVPCTSGGDFQSGIWCPGDGVTDTDRLLHGLYRQAHSAGVRMRTGLAVRKIEVSGGKIRGVETQEGFIRSEIVVNAAGAWAGELGNLAGALPIEHQPFRRHLYYTGELEWVDPRWPFVWDVSHDVYFRPESAGLLLSPCDESRSLPEIPAVDPQMEDLLAEKITVSFPRLIEVPISKTWAGLRTFAPDRRFVIGWDPKVDGFYWVSSLGGHGVTTCAAVGELAARELLDKNRRSDSPFAPARFEPAF